MKNKTYSFLDPIHGNIELKQSDPQDKLILQLIETSEFQRLRRIRQLGFSYMTFYGAESSRFVHSIGTFEVARRMLKHILNFKKISEDKQSAFLTAALLHDIGHGPFSHSSEPAFDFEHERWTSKIILEDTEINQVLRSYNPKFPLLVDSLLKGNLPEAWLTKMVSSQFDCDRADYLLRDSFHTGTKYGVFHLERIINSLRLHKVKDENELVINEKGLHAVEDYLFARYSMYLQVYHHRKTLSADALFCSLIRRAKDLLKEKVDLNINDNLKAFLTNANKMKLSDFHQVDDSTILHYLKEWSSSSKDRILADLASRLLNRKLFKTCKLQNITQSELSKIRKQVGSERADYYCTIKECREFPYQDNKKPIFVMVNNSVKELSKASNIARALLNKEKELDVKWFFFPESL